VPGLLILFTESSPDDVTRRVATNYSGAGVFFTSFGRSRRRQNRIGVYRCAGALTSAAWRCLF
jgi:hypothetical protein